MGTRFKCSNQETVVTTSKGKLKGFYMDGVYAFHGVRYAKAKRFQAPEPLEAWDGVREALSYGYICPILNQPRPTGEVLTPHRFWPENEHCQYLNIWTNSLRPDDKKPVMVWLHGGGFSTGSSIEQVCYDGTNLAKYDDVVLVSINHRLNVFGHLDMSMYGEEFANSVNAGIADIVAALEWIRDNISAFGGNPDNVTVFGQSGGGGKVTALGQTPAAAGLFHKAVVMSGVLSDDLTANDIEPRELVLMILKELNLKENQARELVTVPTGLLIRAVNNVEKKVRADGKMINWAPQANDWYLGDPLERGFTESYLKVPTMVGTVMAEFGFDPPVENKDQLTADERRAIVAKKYGEAHADKLIARFKKIYPDKNEVYVNNLDIMFRPNTVRYIAKKAADGSAPVYSYLFNTEFDYDGGKPAWHCSDIPFWFHNASQLPVCQIDGVTERLEQQMSMSIVNFARTGNPNTAGLCWWPPCTREHIYTMMLDAECHVAEDVDDVILPYLLKAAPKFVFDPSMFDNEDEEGGQAWMY